MLAQGAIGLAGQSPGLPMKRLERSRDQDNRRGVDDDHYKRLFRSSPSIVKHECPYGGDVSKGLWIALLWRVYSLELAPAGRKS